MFFALALGGGSMILKSADPSPTASKSFSSDNNNNDPLPKAFERKTQNKVHLRRQQLAKIMNCNPVEMRQKILKNIQNIRSQMDGLTEEEADVMVTALSLEVVALKRVNSKDATQQQNLRSTSSIRRNQKVRSRNNNRSPSVQRTSPGRPYCNATLQWPKR